MSAFYIPNLYDTVYSEPPKAPVLPRGWTQTKSPDPHLLSFVHKSGLYVLFSLDTMKNETKWVHASITRQDRLPSWQDITGTKDLFIGKNKTAFQVLPDQKSYQNIHPFCLHIWSPAI